MTRKYSAKRRLSILVALAAIFALAGSASATAVTGYSLFGTATYVSPGNNSPTAVEATTVTAPNYGGVDFAVPTGLTVAGLYNLRTDIRATLGTCLTGTPRFGVGVNDGTETHDHYLFFYPTCTPAWTDTGNLASPTSLVDATQLHGPPQGTFYEPYSQVQADYGTYSVTSIFLVVDPSNGLQTIQFDNSQVNDATYTYEVADLSVTKSDSPDPAHVGQKLTYTIVVTNSGPDSATGVTLRDTLPKTAGFGSVSTSQGTCTRAKTVVTCNLGILASAGTATVTIVVKPTQRGTVTNSVTVTSLSPDPVSANNTATASTTVLP